MHQLNHSSPLLVLMLAVRLNVHVQYNLPILDTLGPNNTVLIMEVSLFQRFISTHLYCIGTDTTCPDYRGVLILECPQ